MPHQITTTPTTTDTRALVRKKQFLNILPEATISSLSITDVYSIDKEFSKEELLTIASFLTNPIIQKNAIDTPLTPASFDWAIEVGFLPGVTDNIAHTTKEGIEDALNTKFNNQEAIYTSQITFIEGTLTEKEVNKLAQSLANPLIQHIQIKSAKQYSIDNGMGITIPKVHLREKQQVDEVNLNVDETELETISKEGIANADGTRRGPLALSKEYMIAIKEYFEKAGRNPTDIELETLAQTWSEHCKHTIFASPIDEIKDGIYKHYIKAATEKIRKDKGENDFCVSVFKDNSGAIIFDENWLITDKVETHNSPSALDPYGGAITGIVGVNRDSLGFGKAAKPVMNRYGFCLGEPDDTTPLYRGKNKTNPMLPPKRIAEGVITGVKDGGNQSGIPTPQGFWYFDKGYKGKPLVFAGTVGLAPRSVNGKPGWEKGAQPGDLIVMVGGQVGLDGIHGATFSSEALSEGSPATAVQIGDPITQKKFSDAIAKEARTLNLYNSITDNGAGGLSSSIGEMANESGGCIVYLENVPTKYPGLSPWQIWISESQERMTLSVKKDKIDQLLDLLRMRGSEATIIGEFTNSGKCVVLYNDQKILDIDLNFLHDGLPEKHLKTTYEKKQFTEPNIPIIDNCTSPLLEMLSRPNIASHAFISHQYDHEVQAGSVLKPLQGKGEVNAQATITRPVLDSNKGVVLSQGLYPKYSDINPYNMAASSIDTAIRNAIAAGGSLKHLAILDNFCWCDSTDPYRLGQLKEAAKACYDYAVAFGTPFISGKDSMFNDFKGFDETGNPVKISIPPTLLISSIGVVADSRKAVSLDVKLPGDLVYVLGETKEELGGSEYFAGVANTPDAVGTIVPTVNAIKAKSLYTALEQAIQQELVASAQSITIGGLGIALAKKAIGGQLGMEIDLSFLNKSESLARNDFALFSETQSRIVVTIAPQDKEKFEILMQGQNIALIGTVSEDKEFVIRGFNGNPIVETTIEKLTDAYTKTFGDW
ncbi:MAG: AIR synthase-related protein [bacterium]